MVGYDREVLEGLLGIPCTQVQWLHNDTYHLKEIQILPALRTMCHHVPVEVRMYPSPWWLASILSLVDLVRSKQERAGWVVRDFLAAMKAVS